MDIELLRTFIAVIRTRHFGRAAEQLYLTPAAVSARIRQLEQMLGVNLLHRTRGNIQMTEAGERLLPHAQKLLDAWSIAQTDLALPSRPQQTFRLGYSACLGILMPDCLPPLEHQSLVLHKDTNPGLIQALQQERLDAALLPMAKPQAGLLLHPLGRLTLHFVIAQPRDTKPGCWIDIDWGRPTPSPIDWAWTQEIRCNDWQLALSLLRTHSAGLWLPRHIMLPAGSQALPLDTAEQPCIDVYLACRQEQAQRTELQQLLEQCRTALAEG